MERTNEEHLRLVNWFAGEMWKALERNAHKPHWLDMTAEDLGDKLEEEFCEVQTEVDFGKDADVINEAVDLALVAAFAADNARRRMEGEKDVQQRG